jgi:hypothetical protein
MSDEQKIDLPPDQVVDLAKNLALYTFRDIESFSQLTAAEKDIFKTEDAFLAYIAWAQGK